MAETEQVVAKLSIEVQAQVDEAARQVLSFFEQYTSAINEASAKIKAAEDKMSQYANKVVEVQNKAKQAYNATNQAVEKTKQITTQANAQITSQLSKLGKQLLTIFSIRQIYKWGRQVVSAASTAYEASNLFYVSFGNAMIQNERAADRAVRFANDLATAWGLPARELRNYIGQLNLFNQSMGLSESHSYQLATQLTQMGIEIASLRNIQFADSLDKIKSALAGNSRPLRDIGIAVNDATIKQVAYNVGIAKTGTELSQQQKILARYVAIVQAIQDAGDIGDFARTSDSLEKQTKVFTSWWREIGVILGSTILPYAKDLFYVLNGATQAAVVIAKHLQSVVAGIRGVTAAEMDVDFQAEQKAIESMSDSSGEIPTDFEETNKQLDKMVSKFDKFNALQKESTEDAGAYDPDFDLSKYTLDLPIQDTLEQVEEVTAKVLTFFGFMRDEDTNEWVFKGFPPLLKTIIGLVGSLIGMGIASKITNIVKVLKALNLAKLVSPLGAILALLGYLYFTNEDFRKSIANLGKAAGTIFATIMKAVERLLPAFNAIIDVIGIVLPFLVNIVVTIIDFADKMGILEPIIWAVIIALIALKAIKLFDTIGSWVLKSIDFSRGLDTVAKSAVTANTKILAFMGSVAGLAVGIAALVGGIIYYVQNLGSMSTASKILIPVLSALAAVLVGVAVAKAAAAAGIGAPIMAGITAAALVAAIGLVVGTTIATLPKMADGGMVFGRTAVEVGEYAGARSNPEVIAPLSDLKSYLKVAMTEAMADGTLATRNLNNGRGNQHTIQNDVTINMNNREVARATNTAIIQEDNR